jgi:hypothetical protein
MSGPYTYFPTIPQATDQISNSQPQIQNNFGSIMSLIDVNHGDFATNVAGQHNYVQMPQQGSPPATLAGEVGLYNFPGTGGNQMWVRKSDTTSIPMTQASLALPGYTYLPSGIILQWGLTTSTLPNPYLFSPFPITFTAPPFAIFVTPAVSSATDPDSAFTVIAAGGQAPTTTGFHVMVNRRSSSSGATQNTRQFYWLAIGK